MAFEQFATKIAQEMIFYGSHGCPSCALTLPLLSLAQNKELIEDVRVELYAKHEYDEVLGEIISHYDISRHWNVAKYGIPKPIIMIRLKTSHPLGLVRPEITLNIVDKLTGFLQDNGGELAVMAWLDNEFEYKRFFLQLLLELSSNTLNPIS